MRTNRANETADYVRTQAKELAKLSREAGLDTVAYLLEIASLEAEACAPAKKQNGVFASPH